LRCDIGHLSLFLAMMDGWLKSCEEYVRRNRSKRFGDHILRFENAYKELVAIANAHTTRMSYSFDNLLYLFDDLGLTEPCSDVAGDENLLKERDSGPTTHDHDILSDITPAPSESGDAEIESELY